MSKRSCGWCLGSVFATCPACSARRAKCLMCDTGHDLVCRSEYAATRDVRGLYHRLVSERRTHTRLYFVERENWIKIGISNRVTVRLGQLMSGGTKYPPGMSVGAVSLIVDVPGCSDDERFFHDKFRRQRVEKTEWFVATQSLWDLTDAIRAAGQKGSAEVMRDESTIPRSLGVAA